LTWSYAEQGELLKRITRFVTLIACRCFLYFFEGGNMYDLDKANGNVLATEPAATAAKLSPSDDVSALFGSNSDKLVRIELGDAVATEIADISGIGVNWFDVKRIDGKDVHHVVAVGVGLQFRRWIHLHDDQCRVSTLLHYGRS
jgi:hypothetical protein